jgi:hypothetical protein
MVRVEERDKGLVNKFTSAQSRREFLVNPDRAQVLVLKKLVADHV